MVELLYENGPLLSLSTLIVTMKFDMMLIFFGLATSYTVAERAIGPSR